MKKEADEAKANEKSVSKKKDAEGNGGEWTLKMPKNIQGGEKPNPKNKKESKKEGDEEEPAKK